MGKENTTKNMHDVQFHHIKYASKAVWMNIPKLFISFERSEKCDRNQICCCCCYIFHTHSIHVFSIWVHEKCGKKRWCILWRGRKRCGLCFALSMRCCGKSHRPPLQLFFFHYLQFCYFRSWKGRIVNIMEIIVVKNAEMSKSYTFNEKKFRILGFSRTEMRKIQPYLRVHSYNCSVRIFTDFG